MRIGFGYDIHKFAQDRKLILGGVKIPYELGLLGHSDADVLLHAICDALLGAAGLGDIGGHFPNTDSRFKNISSIILLKETLNKIKSAGYTIGNIDSTIVAEEPKISPYIEKMTKTISEAIFISRSQINIKATTAEGISSIGKKEGIIAYAIALLL